MERERHFPLPAVDRAAQHRADVDLQAYRKGMTSLLSLDHIKKERMSADKYDLTAFLYPIAVGNAYRGKSVRLPPYGLVILSHSEHDSAVVLAVSPLDKKADGHRQISQVAYSNPTVGTNLLINIYRKDHTNLRIHLPFPHVVSTFDYQDGEYYEKWRAVDLNYANITNKWKAEFLDELLFDTRGLDFWKRVRQYEKKYKENGF